MQHDTDVCAAYVPLGTPCDSPLPCGPEATCTEGVCAPWKPLICYVAP